MAKSSVTVWSVSAILLPLLVAIVAHFVLFDGVDQPQMDHGSGSMFDMIAGRYDMINRVLALGMDVGWRKTMVAQIKEHVLEVPHPRILDVSTGTADVALLLAADMPQATVLGIDPSANMLDIGRSKIQQLQRSNQVTLEKHDARDLSGVLAKSSSALFDAATMAFGIRNVPERHIALCQIHSLLKKDARFCILEFSEPDESFGYMGAAVRFFIRHVIPFVGGILSGAPREYWHLQKSIKEFPSPKQFAKQIQQLTCDSGTFHVDQVHQLMYGSVQIYSINVERRTEAEIVSVDEIEQESADENDKEPGKSSSSSETTTTTTTTNEGI